jgi:hypothetical protein
MQYNSINIILLQEVVKEGFNFMTGSTAHINRGTQKWGTQMFTEESLETSDWHAQRGTAPSKRTCTVTVHRQMSICATRFATKLHHWM